MLLFELIFAFWYVNRFALQYCWFYAYADKPAKMLSVKFVDSRIFFVDYKSLHIWIPSI